MANTERYKTVPLSFSWDRYITRGRKILVCNSFWMHVSWELSLPPMVVSQLLYSSPQKHKIHYLALTLNHVFTDIKPAVLISHMQDHVCSPLPTLLFVWPYRKLYQPVLLEAKLGKVFS